MNKKICFTSDNYTPVHPLIMQSIVNANNDNAPSYGADIWTLNAEKLIKKTINDNPQILFLPTGTGANVLALKIACRRYESVICTDIAHINYQECGAAESIVGCKLLTVNNQLGKLTPEIVLKKLKSEQHFGKHSTKPRIISITQPTEIGTIYSLEELSNLKALCRKENLLLHIDGSRIYNSIAALNTSFDELLQAACPDIVSLGGTKNGCMLAEALLIFNDDLKEHSSYIQKQTLQLVSKMRYISAQFIALFQNSLWRDLALQANQKAKEIAQLIQKIPGVSLSYPVETNQIFFTVPSELIASIQEKISCSGLPLCNSKVLCQSYKLR